MIENRMVIDSEWPEDDFVDYWEDNATEGMVIDCLFDEELVHLFFESYLEADDLDNKEEECEAIFEAMCAKNPVSFHQEFREWMKMKEYTLHDIFNAWYAKKYED